MRQDARWSDGITATVALWGFTLLLYLPMIIGRYTGLGLLSVVLDSATVGVSMLFGLLLFWLFRLSLPLPGQIRLVALVAAVLGIALAQVAFDLFYTALVASSLEQRWTMVPTDLNRSYESGFKYACVFAVNAALFQLGMSRRRSRRQERQLAEVRAAMKQAEIDSLRLKLNPHFLFNTLNAISAMVVLRRNDEAEQGLERLSDFLRASLSSDPERLLTLEEELQIVDHYARIEEMRFGDRLTVDFACPGDVGGVAVPALLIQPLIEAAIRDGVEASATPVRITVSASRAGGELHLCVSDDVPREESPEAAAMIADVRCRLAGLYGAAADVVVRMTGQGTAATLRLPLGALGR